MSYPWYETIKNSNEIRQGDFIFKCPILIPPSNFRDSQSYDAEISVRSLDTIIVSQSCDLENNKIELVLVCPYYTLDYFFSQLPESDRTTRGREKKLEALKNGNLHSYHLLNKDESNGVDHFNVVDFKNVYGVSFNFLKIHALSLESRPRLLPPYREHLSQAFARFFMRVGLPNDIIGLK